MIKLQNKYRRKQVFYKDLSEPDFGDWAVKLYENNDFGEEIDNNPICFDGWDLIEANNPDNVWQLYKEKTEN